MTRTENFKTLMRSGAPLAGTFMKTPAYELIEALAKSGLDFVCIDTEHAPFDRGRMDACMAMARALDFPVLVRVSPVTNETVLQALDSGAVGIVCPHIDSAEAAAAAVNAAHFGKGGRSFAGATRWGRGAPMAEILDRSQKETVVIVQIEEPEAVDVAEAIAGTPGVDGVFLGPSDLTVAYGKTELGSPELMAAFERCGTAAKDAGVAFMTFVKNGQEAEEMTKFGVSMFFIASEVVWMINGAKADAAAVHALKS